MLDTPLKNLPFHIKLDMALETLEGFTPIEKQALRGAVLEVLFKYQLFLNQEKPTTSVAFDVYKMLLAEMLKVDDLDLNSIEKYIRAYNSKVPKECSLEACTIMATFENLANRFRTLKSVS
jgi:hypothetical protein